VTGKRDALRAFILDAHAGRGPKPGGEAFARPSESGQNPHAGPIPAGQRDVAIRNYIRLVVGRSHTKAEVEALVERRWRDMEQPKGNEYPLEEALSKIDTAVAKFGLGGTVVGDFGDLPDALKERAEAPGVAQALQRIRAQREALAVDAEIEAHRRAAAPVDIDTLDAMLARPEEERWRVEGLLPAEGRLLVVAQRKTGKTTLVNNLTASLVTGEPFLGRMAVEPVKGSVMLLNYEVSGATFKRWLGDLGLTAAAQKRIVIVNLRGRDNLLATETGRLALADLMRRRNVEVLAVDPFGRAFSGDNQDSNSQVTPWLVNLDKVATEGGAREVILVAHAGWGGADRGQTAQVRARGASALEDWADSILRYSKQNDLDGAPRFLEAEGRDVYLEKDRLDYDADTRRLTLTGAGGPGVARKAVKARVLAEPILDIVRQVGGITASGIEVELRRRDVTFTRGDHSAAIGALVAEGQLERFADGTTRRHYLPGTAPAKVRGVTPITTPHSKPKKKEKDR
jgi:hypothetical protein